MSNSPGIMDLATNRFTDEEIGVRTDKTFKFAVELHTPNGNLGIADMIFFKDLAIFRDYEDNFADMTELSISIPLGTFLYDVYDHVENLEITVKKLIQFHTSAKGDVNSKPHARTIRYKAVFLKDKNAALPTSRSMSRDDLNQRIPAVVLFQLVDKAAEAIRLKTTGGCFATPGGGGITQEQMLRNVFSTELNKIRIEGVSPIDVFDIRKPDNKTAVKSINTTSYQRLVELPDFLQEKAGGVYNDGLGLYTQSVMTAPGEYQNCLSIFNLYNPDNEDDTDSLIYCVEESAKVTNYVGAIHDGSGLGIVVLAHRLSGLDDDKGTKALNTGTGFRVMDASKMLHAPVTYTESGAVFDRNKTSTEIVGKSRADGGDLIVNHGVGNNNFILTSDVFKRGGTYATVQVSNSDHEIFPPGKKYALYYRTSTTEADGTSKAILGKRFGYILQLITTYSNNLPNLLANSTSSFVEVTSHTTLKVIVGKLIDDSNPNP